jgi:hypothetical protein
MLSAAAIQAVGSAGIIFALLTIRHELRRMRLTEMREIYSKAFPVYITNIRNRISRDGELIDTEKSHTVVLNLARENYVNFAPGPARQRGGRSLNKESK